EGKRFVSRIGSAQAMPAGGDRRHSAIEGNGVELRRATIVREEVDRFAIPRPDRTANVAVERAGQTSGIAAVRIHDIEVSDGVALKLPVKTQVGDLRAARRWHRPAVGTFATGELLDGSIRDRELIDVAAFEVVVGFRRALCRYVDPLAIVTPGEAPR